MLEGEQLRACHTMPDRVHGLELELVDRGAQRVEVRPPAIVEARAHIRVAESGLFEQDDAAIPRELAEGVLPHFERVAAVGDDKQGRPLSPAPHAQPTPWRLDPALRCACRRPLRHLALLWLPALSRDVGRRPADVGGVGVVVGAEVWRRHAMLLGNRLGLRNEEHGEWVAL